MKPEAPGTGAVTRAEPDPSTTRQRLLWFTESAVVLAVVLPAMVVLTTEDAGRSTAWTLTLAILVWAGIRLSVIIAGGKPRLFEFIFWLFVYIFLGLAPTIQIRTAAVASTTKDMPASVDWPTALLVALSLIVFEAGRTLPAGRRTRAAGYRGGRLSPRWTWLLFAIGLAFLLYYVQSLGLESFFQNREARQEARSSSFEDKSSGAIIGALAWVPLLIAAGSFATMGRLRRAVPRARAYRIAAVVGVLAVLVVMNPISGARYTSGTVMFAMLCYTGILTRKRLIRPLLGGLLAAFLLLFPIADAFRRSEVSVGRTGFFSEYAGNGDYDAFWQIANSYLYIQSEGPTWGRQALGVLLFWVPRSLWTGKPDDTGLLLAGYRGYSFTNLSAPLWAEALINGGMVALVATFLALGLLIVRLDRRLPQSLRSDSGLAIAASVFPAYMIILLRGSMLQATGVFTIMLLSIVLVSSGGKRDDAAAP
ncbi:hypothetical protein ACFQ36_08405 [Arthrobacter sp. GCM10027362]|uniref:hypothetical protein n=1 Tax=Arthrobacter sp. GCM10027362 TaxID=3273379 RepID=UPI0036331553